MHVEPAESQGNDFIKSKKTNTMWHLSTCLPVDYNSASQRAIFPFMHQLSLHHTNRCFANQSTFLATKCSVFFLAFFSSAALVLT